MSRLSSLSFKLSALLILLVAGPLSAQTDLYERYASRTDIKVASVTNFTLDEGVTADVTLLEAVEDAGWEWMCREFGLAPLTSEQQQQIEQGWDVVLFTQRYRQDPTKPVPVSGESVSEASTCYLGVSYMSRTIYIFCCGGSRQSSVVVDYLIEKMRHTATHR